MELSNILQLLWACMKSSALTVRDGNKKSRTGNHKILFHSPASLSLWTDQNALDERRKMSLPLAGKRANRLDGVCVRVKGVMG